MAFADRLGVGALIMSLIGIAITILWPTQRWIGWTALGFSACLGVWWLWLEFAPKSKADTKSKEAQQITSGEWKDLASRFQKFPAAYVRAEWYSEHLDERGNRVGERWMIRDDWKNQYASQCEALCRLAGAMLLKSPKVSKTLSEKVRSRSDDVWRWLYFLAERDGVIQKIMTGETKVGRERLETWMKMITQLTLHSGSACLDCAAKEI